MFEGLNQNQDFFSLLLGNDEIKKEVLGIFAEEIYRGLRARGQKRLTAEDVCVRMAGLAWKNIRYMFKVVCI